MAPSNGQRWNLVTCDVTSDQMRYVLTVLQLSIALHPRLATRCTPTPLTLHICLLYQYYQASTFKAKPLSPEAKALMHTNRAEIKIRSTSDGLTLTG